MYDDALRVAEDYIPTKMQEVHLSIAAESAAAHPGHHQLGLSDERVSSVVKTAKAYEKACHFIKAVELYLTLDTDATTNHDLLQKVLITLMDML